MRTKILVPTNFSDHSDIALRQSVLFAEKTGAEIFLLNILKNIDKTDILYSEKIIEQSQKKIDKIIEHISKERAILVNYRLGCGKILNEILKAEEEINPDWIFLGSDVSENNFNSKSLKLIYSVSCPLVIFHSTHNILGCKNIVLPLDLTKETQQKIDVTLKIAKIYNSTVHLLSIWFSGDEKEKTYLEEQLEKVRNKFDANHVKTVSKFLYGKTEPYVLATTVNSYANEIEADLIIIMTRQETKIRSLIIGSLASKVIKKSTIPILCIGSK